MSAEVSSRITRNPSSPQASARPGPATLAAALLLVAIVALPYLQVRHFDFVNYDDPMHVSNQPWVLDGLSLAGIEWSLTATDSNLWHPLTWVSYMTDVSLLGGGADHPGAHHLVNLALHLLAVLALFALLRQLGAAPLLAWLAAALYGLHPLQAEPVAWISSRKDVLSSLLALLCLLSYCRGRIAVMAGIRPAVLWRIATWVLLAAALASKPSTVILPGLFVVIDGWLARSRERTSGAWFTFLARRALAQWPFLLLAGAAALIAIAVQQGGSHGVVMAGQSIVDRLLLLPARIGFFIQRTFWPLNMAFDYPVPTGPRLLLWSALGLGSLGLVPWLLCSRSPKLRFLGLGLAWYLLCLLPVLGLVYVSPSFTNDRYLHLGLAGPLLALALVLSPPLASGPRRQRLPAIATAAVLLPLFCVLTWRQTAVWRNDAALFRHAVKAAPMSATAWSNLASWHGSEGRRDQALENYQRALAIEPAHPIANYNVGYLHWIAGRRAGAVQSLQRSIVANPIYAPAHNLLGVIFSDSSRLDSFRPRKGLKHLRRAHELRPDRPLFLKDYAEALLAYGDFEQALQVLEQAMPLPKATTTEHEEVRTLYESLKAMR